MRTMNRISRVIQVLIASYVIVFIGLFITYLLAILIQGESRAWGVWTNYYLAAAYWVPALYLSIKYLKRRAPTQA